VRAPSANLAHEGRRPRDPEAEEKHQRNESERVNRRNVGDTSVQRPEIETLPVGDRTAAVVSVACASKADLKSPGLAVKRRAKTATSVALPIRTMIR